MQQSRINNQESGFTLFIAMVIMGTLMLIATSIVSLAIRQGLISSSGRESQYAFYAADSGIECALFWDVKNPNSANGESAFATSSGSIISCNNSAGLSVGGSETSTFSLTLTPDPYCVSVTVNKFYQRERGRRQVLVTKIESRGYNTCDPSNPRRVERAVRATY